VAGRPLAVLGRPPRYNRRDTLAQPTKSGILGLFGVVEGRPREACLTDLLSLHLGVRVDQPGTLLRDYHTVSDYRGLPLPSTKVDARGIQKSTNPLKYTDVTQRYYLQDAMFTAALRGPTALLEALEHSCEAPGIPLSLGRRSCPPTGPLSLGLRPDADLQQVLTDVPWQASAHRRRIRTPQVMLEVTVDDPAGDLSVDDVPDTYDFKTGLQPTLCTALVGDRPYRPRHDRPYVRIGPGRLRSRPLLPPGW
jgi:CRISPR system Cascade subunit CasD